MFRNRSTFGIAFAAFVAALTTIASASEHEELRREGHDSRLHERPARPAPFTPEDIAGAALYRKECGSCHLAFPPGLLTAASHRRILAGLERHFGQDAEVDPAVRDRLAAWLIAHSAESGSDRRSGKVVSSSRPGDAPERLTEASWFQRKHRKVGPHILSRPSIRTFANCGACHAGAANWDFEDNEVKIPSQS